jgi:hypothetical protein
MIPPLLTDRPRGTLSHSLAPLFRGERVG